MRENRLPKKSLRLWQTRCGLIAVFPFTAFLIGTFRNAVCVLPLICFIAVVLWTAFFYLPRYCAVFSLEIGKQYLLVRRGVWFRHCDLIPFPATVYTAAFSTPLARRMGLSALSFKMIRGWLILPEMRRDTVSELLAEVHR